MHAHLRAFAESFGIHDLKLRDRSPNTRRALAIAEFSRDRGKLECFRQVAMDAHWRRGLDLESDRDLKALTSEVGLEPEAAIAATYDPAILGRLEQKRIEAEDLGVTGIPTFVAGGQAVVGCQPYEVLAELVESAGARKGSRLG